MATHHPRKVWKLSPRPARNETPEVMSDKELAKAGSQEVAVQVPEYNTEDLQNLKEWGDLDAFVAQYGIDVLPADQTLGDGFGILKDKHKLVGVPMMILEWRTNTGDNTKGAGGFTSMRVVAKADNNSMLKYIVNDGSQGIHKQLTEFTESRKVRGGLFVKKGLSASDYEVEVDGVMKPVTTFYLDTSA